MRIANDASPRVSFRTRDSQARRRVTRQMGMKMHSETKNETTPGERESQKIDFYPGRHAGPCLETLSIRVSCWFSG